jgi:threonine dehydrogenase-like Zn-dependent dehydrogenase
MLFGVRRLAICEIPVSAPAAGEVRVRIQGVGLCGSDLALYSGRRSAPLPLLLGHEAFGVIDRVGAGVSEARLGERVVIEPNVTCGHCQHCRSGRTSLCPDKLALGVDRPGLLIEHAVVPARLAWSAPRDLAAEDLACLEPLAVAQAAVRRSTITSQAPCVVFGAGPQGLLLTMLLAALSHEVTVIEPQAARRRMAREVGAASALEAFTPGLTAAYVFEAANAPSAVEDALQAVAAGGVVTLLGLTEQEVRFQPLQLVRRQVEVHGSLVYDHPLDFDRTLQLVSDLGLRPGRIVRARFALTEAAEALEAAGTIGGKAWIAVTQPNGGREHDH